MYIFQNFVKYFEFSVKLLVKNRSFSYISVFYTLSCLLVPEYAVTADYSFKKIDITVIPTTYVNIIIKRDYNWQFFMEYCVFSDYDTYHEINYDRCYYRLAKLNDNAITALEFPSISKIHHELSAAIHNAFFSRQFIAYHEEHYIDISARAR